MGYGYGKSQTTAKMPLRQDGVPCAGSLQVPMQESGQLTQHNPTLVEFARG